MIEKFKNKMIGVVCGGYSSEREISLRSGKAVYEALQNLGYQTKCVDPSEGPNWTDGIDVAFLVLHGKFGEDGTVQALLEWKGIPYTGSGVNTSVVAINKASTKEVFKQQNLSTANYRLESKALNNLPEGFSYPIFLKPYDGGSSVDTFACDTLDELHTHTSFLVKKYGTYLLESFVEGKELTIGLIENPDLITLPILELRVKNRFYDFEAKYTPGLTEFILPAEISEADAHNCRQLAKQVYSVFRCKGAVRVDMILQKNGEPSLLELNTLPGMTQTSDLPAQAKQAGMSFEELTECILSSACR